MTPAVSGLLGPLWGSFADRSVQVIDVAGLDPLAQDLVFARVVSMLREHLERRHRNVVIGEQLFGQCLPA